jgi:hypothetical protein
VERQNFSWIVLQKGMPFWGISLGKEKLSADNTVERHVIANYSASRQAFPQ